ncbi:MAG: acyl-CoA dehydrogenase family protein [Desulfobacterales bacterium]
MLVKNSVREYIRDKIAPLADDADRRGPLSGKAARDHLNRLAPFGYVGPLVPAEDGGPGLSHVEAGIIYQELAGVWPALGLLALCTSHAGSLLLRSDNAPLRRRFLPGLLCGDIIGAVAVTEPGAGIDTTAISTSAEPSGDYYIISGEKSWVSNGGIADILIVAVNVGKNSEDVSPRQFILVEKEASMVVIEEIPKMGLKGISTSRLVFDRCKVPKQNVLGPIFPASRPTPDFEDAHCCLSAALAVGIAATSFELSVSYARQRVQFGKVLGQFQMIQRMIAQMATGVDAAFLLCFRALKRLDEGASATKETAMAKTFAARTAVEAASTAIQIHGAYGYSDEFPMERCYRDACCLNLVGGHADMQDLRIAEAVTGFAALT